MSGVMSEPLCFDPNDTVTTYGVEMFRNHRASDGEFPGWVRVWFFWRNGASVGRSHKWIRLEDRERFDGILEKWCVNGWEYAKKPDWAWRLHSYVNAASDAKEIAEAANRHLCYRGPAEKHGKDFAFVTFEDGDVTLVSPTGKRVVPADLHEASEHFFSGWAACCRSKDIA